MRNSTNVLSRSTKEKKHPNKKLGYWRKRNKKFSNTRDRSRKHWTWIEKKIATSKVSRRYKSTLNTNEHRSRLRHSRFNDPPSGNVRLKHTTTTTKWEKRRKKTWNGSAHALYNTGKRKGIRCRDNRRRRQSVSTKWHNQTTPACFFPYHLSNRILSPLSCLLFYRTVAEPQRKMTNDNISRLVQK